MRKLNSIAFTMTSSPVRLSNYNDTECPDLISQDVSCFFQFETNSYDHQPEFDTTPKHQRSSKYNDYSCSTDSNNDGMEIESFQQVNMTDSALLIQKDLIFDNQSKDTSTNFLSQESQFQTLRKKAKKWTQREDKLLLKQHRQQNGRWEEIAKFIQGRNASQCFQRWRRMFPEQRINVQFSEKTDQEIIRLVSQIGKKWTRISQVIVDFSPKQIRDRYVNVLDRKINKESFSNEEDQQIISQYMELGPKWKKIADQLENRTDNDVKNRFYGNLRKRYFGIQNRYQTIHKHK